jgi:hypothetical protein
MEYSSWSRFGQHGESNRDPYLRNRESYASEETSYSYLDDPQFPDEAQGVQSTNRGFERTINDVELDRIRVSLQRCLRGASARHILRENESPTKTIRNQRRMTVWFNYTRTIRQKDYSYRHRITVTTDRRLLNCTLVSKQLTASDTAEEDSSIRYVNASYFVHMKYSDVRISEPEWISRESNP